VTEILTIRKLLNEGIRRLEACDGENARMNAELLLSFVLSRDKLDLICNSLDAVDGIKAHEYYETLMKRLRGVPIQYITGTTDFYNVTLKVNENVLIPRPETEVLVDTIMGEVGGGRFNGCSDDLRLLDLGTGSGSISIALLNALSPGRELRIIATDISREALEVARENSKQYGFESLIELRCGDMFDCIREDETFHIIVSNPPYVSTGEFGSLPGEVKDHEPRLALMTGETGLEHITSLVHNSGNHLRSPGLLICEIGDNQADPVKELMKEFGYTNVSIRRDLAGRDRIALIRR